MSKQQCPECVSGDLQSTVQKIASGPYKDLCRDSIDRMLGRVCNRVTSYLELADSFPLTKADRDDALNAASREWRRRHLFQGGMAPEKALCSECIGGDLRKAVRGICIGSYQGLGYSSIDHMLDEIYRKMASYLELAEKFAFVTDAWKAQSVAVSSVLGRGWKRRQWERYVGKGRGRGAKFGWLVRAHLVIRRRSWAWAPGVTLEKVLAADAELRAFAEMRQRE